MTAMPSSEISGVETEAKEKKLKHQSHWLLLDKPTRQKQKLCLDVKYITHLNFAFSILFYSNLYECAALFSHYYRKKNYNAHMIFSTWYHLASKPLINANKSHLLMVRKAYYCIVLLKY